MGLFLLVLFFICEVGLFIMSIAGESSKLVYVRNRLILNLSEFAVFGLLLPFSFVSFGMRYNLLYGILILRALYAIVLFFINRRKASEKRYQVGSGICRVMGNVVMLFIAFVPVFVFHDYEGLETTGPYAVGTYSEIYVDPYRKEPFETDGSNREIPVEFWYPLNAEKETFPVIFFSHGSFGYRESNFSTYEELASHGYVVCSMDHPYHSLFTEDTDGKTITVNPAFIQEVMGANAEGAKEEDIFKQSHQWLAIRENDMNHVIDTVKDKSRNKESAMYSMIDCDKIGVMGHSLGGAASIALGRERGDIDAVIDLDGTMVSEQIGYDGEKYLYCEESYPVPFLSIISQSHHDQSDKYDVLYVNRYVLEHALDGKETYFVGAEHLNFTDLPMISDVLAKLLGEGSIDKEHCIKEMNSLVVSYFDEYLKNGPEVEIKDHYE